MAADNETPAVEIIVDGKRWLFYIGHLLRARIL
jgi:hypothetical protein